MEYNHTFGQIGIEAGQLYKAVKNNQVKALPETVSLFYNEKKAYFGLAEQRYNQDHTFYDDAYKMTSALLDGDYSKAQEFIDSIESDCIRLAGKKSPFFKYRKEEN